MCPSWNTLHFILLCYKLQTSLQKPDNWKDAWIFSSNKLFVVVFYMIQYTIFSTFQQVIFDSPTSVFLYHEKISTKKIRKSHDKYFSRPTFPEKQQQNILFIQLLIFFFGLFCVTHNYIWVNKIWEILHIRKNDCDSKKNKCMIKQFCFLPTKIRTKYFLDSSQTTIFFKDWLFKNFKYILDTCCL